MPVLDMEWYPSGQIKYVRTHQNGIPAGYVEWHPNGHRHYQWVVTDLVKDSAEWSPEGEKMGEGHLRYVKGVWAGRSTGYYPDGKTRDVMDVDGLVTSDVSYYPDGKKKEARNERDESLEGVFQSWDEKGVLQDDGVYRNDKPWSGKFTTIRSGRGSSWSDTKVHYYIDGKEVGSPQ